MSPSELIETYFLGVPLRDQTGGTMSMQTVALYIKAAQEEVEKYLSIKLNKQVIQEQKSFYYNDFMAWGGIRTTYPVMKPHRLEGFVNTTKQIEYPAQWLMSKKTSDGQLFHRLMYILPTQGNATGNSIAVSGIFPQVGFFGNSNIPYYWTCTYCTGFEQVPMDLVNFIGKYAAINIFHIMGDLILGAGIASQSIGLDGLSQSISSTASATNAGYGARITGYLKDLEESLPRLVAYYKGITISNC